MTKRDKLIEMLQNKDCIKDISNKVKINIEPQCESCKESGVVCDNSGLSCFDATNYYLDTEYTEPITLSDKDKELLNALKILDFKYIARDFDDSLYAFKEKPEKHGKCWDDNSVYYHFQKIDEYLFKFIQWSDDEPYSVDELLKFIM